MNGPGKADPLQDAFGNDVADVIVVNDEHAEVARHSRQVFLNFFLYERTQSVVINPAYDPNPFVA
jgi:hypothetical protein